MSDYAPKAPAPMSNPAGMGKVVQNQGNEYAHPYLQLQRDAGAETPLPINRSAKMRPWQTKLKVGSAFDPAEAEADNAAREVVGKGSGASGANGAGAGKGLIQTKPLVARISRKVQRTELDEADAKLQRQEEEASPKLMREEDEEASPKLMRQDDEEASPKLMRQEDEEASPKLMRQDDEEASPRLMRQEDEEASPRLMREEEEEEASPKLMRQVDEEAAPKLMREEDEEAAPKLMRQEEDKVDAKCADCEKEEAMPKQLQNTQSQAQPQQLATNNSQSTTNNSHLNGFTATQETHDLLKSRKGAGEPMPEPLKNEMEAGFGADFSKVKIHRDSASTELNKDLKAKAFTHGEDVFFGQGQFDAGSDQGKELIAHELTHTIQQGAVEEKKSGTMKSPSTATKTTKKGASTASSGTSATPGTKLPPKAESAGTAGEGSMQKAPGQEEPQPEGEAEEKKDIPKAPQRPEDDKEFQKVLGQVKGTAEEQKVHPDPEEKVAEVDEAAELPEDKQEFANDAEAQMGQMDEEGEVKKREPFTAKTFKDKLAKNLKDLEENLPKDEEAAAEFKENDEISGVKDGIAADVTTAKGEVVGNLEQQSKPGDPPPTGLPTKEGVPLKKDPEGKAPAGINPRAAIPKPKTDEEISMEAESENLDTVMAENNVTETQLENSNEPKFTEGLEQKRTAQTEAANAPAEYRKAEEEKLEGAKLLANQSTKAGFKGMFDARKGSLGGVNQAQSQTEKTDEQMQAEINLRFEEIYKETKDKVDTTLTKLSETVETYFDDEAEKAKAKFEENVEMKLDDIYGWTVIDDWLWGADTVAIEQVFVEEKAIFVKTMDGILDKIAQGIADALNYAVTVIKEGRKKSKDYYDGLDKKQQSLAKESYESYNDQYTSLEDTVYEKEDELASGLADAYKENLDSLRETFDTIKEKVAAGWIGAALAAIWGIIKTILKLFEMLMQLLSAVVEAIGAILADPIGFLMNLIDGVKLGLDNFVANIKTHLVTGLVEWLTGSLGGVGITIPKDLFSLSGIFSLAGQILGLSWDYFRAKAVKKLGEPMVKGIEAAVDIFIIVKNEGLDGLWKMVSEKFQDIQVTVMDAIKEMIITKVVEAGIKWIIGLLNPASAFVKAVMMVIDIAKFFIERAAEIIELVMAFIDGIRALASGNIDGVAKMIEKALAKAIPILLGFLASLLGITGLTAKVTKIIKKIRTKVDKAINKLIGKAARMFKKKGKKGKDGKPVEEDVKGLTPADHKKHQEYVAAIEKELMTPPKKKLPTFEDFYAYKQKQIKEIEAKYNKKLTKKVNGKPLKTTITMGALAAEKKDNDLDIEITIAPNDAKKKVVVLPGFKKCELEGGFDGFEGQEGRTITSPGNSKTVHLLTKHGENVDPYLRLETETIATVEDDRKTRLDNLFATLRQKQTTLARLQVEYSTAAPADARKLSAKIDALESDIVASKDKIDQIGSLKLKNLKDAELYVKEYTNTNFVTITSVWKSREIMVKFIKKALDEKAQQIQDFFQSANNSKTVAQYGIKDFPIDQKGKEFGFAVKLNSEWKIVKVDEPLKHMDVYLVLADVDNCKYAVETAYLKP